MLVHFETLGCKLNQIESESAARFFEEAGFQIDMVPVTALMPESTETVLCVVNTCTVTTKAEQKARRIIRLLFGKFPRAAVLVTGCYAEVSAGELEALGPQVVVLPGKAKDALADIPKKLLPLFSGQHDAAAQNAGTSQDSANTVSAAVRNVLRATAMQHGSFKLCTDTFHQHTRSSIKIQDGCDNACSYCRIHIARGKSVSLDAEKVLERVRSLEKSGQSEVTLTGVNLGQYKSVLRGEPAGFAELLAYLLENTGRIAFRVSSLYPDKVDETLCRVLESPRVRPHFHLSVQSGSDAVLRAMRRTYRSADVLKACGRLRAAKPGCFIACDIITGFPGETDGDFAATMNLAQKCAFSWIHVFPFSPRPGTPAFSMKGQVPASVSRARAAALADLAQTQAVAYIQSWVGKPLQAVVEKRHLPELRAVTENFIHVTLEAPPLLAKAELAALGGRETAIQITAPLAPAQSDDSSPIIKAKGILLPL